jgi:hypothetical protein
MKYVCLYYVHKSPLLHFILRQFNTVRVQTLSKGLAVIYAAGTRVGLWLFWLKLQYLALK